MELTNNMENTGDHFASPSPYLSLSHMKRQSVKLLLVLVIVILVGVALWYSRNRLLPVTQPALQSVAQVLPSNSPALSNAKAPTDLPIALTDPHVLNTAVAYALLVTVKEISPEGDNYVITPTEPIVVIPKFRIAKNVSLPTYPALKDKMVKASAVKIGNSLYIVARYDYSNNTWYTDSVEVINGPLPTPDIRIRKTDKPVSKK